MTTTFLWAAFFVFAAMFLMAVIVRGVSRMARGEPASSHPFRRERAGDASRRHR
jgi:Na+-transporting methylmalonyl-CoA/oxaloacetate decarboxylase gamma subunit